jgi:excisionase family DNA binding protein
MANVKGWLTSSEAARVTGYNLEYIRRLVRTKKIQAKKWGRDWMISQTSILGYQEKDKRRGPRSK